VSTYVLALIPKRFQHVAKALVGLAGVVVTAVVTAVPDLPRWAAVVVAVLTAAGVYQTPNVTPEDGGDDSAA